MIPRHRVLVNCPLLLPLPRDQLMRMPVKVRVRSFRATIRETSSRPNRHLCHRGSHNDDDHDCKIIPLPSHFPLAVKEPLRSRRTSISLRLPRPPSKVEKLHQQPPERSLASDPSHTTIARNPGGGHRGSEEGRSGVWGMLIVLAARVIEAAFRRIDLDQGPRGSSPSRHE